MNSRAGPSPKQGRGAETCNGRFGKISSRYFPYESYLDASLLAFAQPTLGGGRPAMDGSVLSCVFDCTVYLIQGSLRYSIPVEYGFPCVLYTVCIYDKGFPFTFFSDTVFSIYGAFSNVTACIYDYS